MISPTGTATYCNETTPSGDRTTAKHRYFIKWVLGQLLAIYSLFFWHVPRSDNELIECLEGTSLIIVVNRDFEAEAAEKVGGGRGDNGLGGGSWFYRTVSRVESGWIGSG